MRILYEDNHLLIVCKPADMLTQPNNSQETSLEEECKRLIKERDSKPGNVFLHAVHRIDKPVSGIVMFAKTSKALSRMNAALRGRQMKKIYHARISGTLPAKEGTLEHYLRHDDFRAVVDPEGKLCRLHYRLLDNGIVEIDLETGRYHQIRAQLAAVGCPVKGDGKYGSIEPWKQGIALHHAVLTFPHPVTGEMITVSCPWESDDS